jgi:hypothetical protein
MTKTAHIDTNLTERQGRIMEILNFKGYEAPEWLEPFTNDELFHANLWQVTEIEKLIDNK